MPQQQDSASPTLDPSKPVVIITGAAGNIGSALTRSLQPGYKVVALDRKQSSTADASYEFDLTKRESVQQALEQVAREQGRKVAAVIHLAAYFDFTGEKSPLYDAVNVQGTRNLVAALKDTLEVERFIYSGTMLVHKPGKPGTKTTEDTPLEPGWAYPQSKAETEAVIRENAGSMPYTILRLAGLYDEQTTVPTLAHQIARIYEEDFHSYLYAGDKEAGQAFIHRDDMMDVFVRTVDRRAQLPAENIMLAGEEEVAGYEALQNRIGQLIHGDDKWRTISLPEPMAKAGAWVEEKAEPIVPDAIDHGEKPFIRPFMIDMASDHYDLDCTRAHELLGWRATHNLFDELEVIVGNLKKDPLGWYQKNRITPPDWMTAAAEKREDPERVLETHHERYHREHRQTLWARFATLGLGAWLLASPPTLGYAGTGMAASDSIAGLALLILGFFSLSWRMSWARWATALVGVWLLFAPLVFWTSNPAAYLNGTLVGMLAIGFSAATRPLPGVSPAALATGPECPPGWDHNPSSWLQRLPIIALALIGLLISRYLTAYQLGHIDSVWEPFFGGATDDPRNGTEEIITSSLSEAWPVADAGLGAMVYSLEILAGLIGATNRWRTAPWVVVLFGLMIVPLGVVSITFIIIQPILLGTWCTLCLVQAGAMTLQIPYFLNEMVATGQFLRRRKQAARPLLQVFFVGDTDEGHTRPLPDRFARAPLSVLREAFTGSIGTPWNLLACIAIGIWLMLTRLTLANEPPVANWDHLVGALVITVAICAFAEVARPVRLLIIPLALPLFIVPFVYGANLVAMISSLVCGALLIVLSLRRGDVKCRYGGWNRRIV